MTKNERKPRQTPPIRLDNPAGSDGGASWGLIEFTPALSERILLGVPMGDAGIADYVRNREGLERDMAAGEFLVTGDTVVIARDGILNDGRARCLASARTRTSFWAFLVTGADPETRFSMDVRQSATRRPSPGAPIPLGGGEAEAAGLVRRACVLAEGLGIAPNATGIVPAVPGDLERAFEEAKGVREEGGLNRASLAAFRFLASGRDPARAAVFAANLREGRAVPGSREEAVLAAFRESLSGTDSAQGLAEMAEAWFSSRSGIPYVPGRASASPKAVDDVLARFALPRRDAAPILHGEPDREGGRPAPTVGMETIGPGEAARILAEVGTEGMGDHAEIVEDLRAGLWQVNYQTLKFDWNGRLLDGRRRLRAVVDAGVPVRTMVARGLPPQVAKVLHKGRRTNLGHRLQAESGTYRQPFDIAAAARNILCLTSGEPGLQPSVPAMRQAMIRYPRIVEGVQVVKGLKDAYRMRVGIAASCYALMAAEDERAAKVFVHRLARTPLCDDGSPVLALRRRLCEDRPRDTVVGQAAMSRLILAAWREERVRTGAPEPERALAG